MNLYEIAAEYKKVFEELSEMEGLTEDIINDTLSPISKDFDELAIIRAKHYKNIEAEIDAIKNAEDLMYKRRTILERKSKRFINSLKDAMIIREKNKIPCPYFVIKLSKGGKSVEIIDENKIPKKYMNEKKTYTPNKDAIKEAGGCEGAAIKDVWRLTIK